MADSFCDCGGSGFLKRGTICVWHLPEAYATAISLKDVEMAAVILAKHMGKLNV